LPPCSRFELREFGPVLPAPAQMPGWTCTGQSGTDEHVTVTVLQTDFRHLQAYAFVNQARLAEWGTVDFHRRGGEYVFQGDNDAATFRIGASPRGTAFDATLELMTHERHFDVRDVHCSVADR